ncbi:MAG: aquaporin [Rhodospirillaceae bacterium]
MRSGRRRQLFIAEFTATAFLLIAVVGSGIMAHTLSAGNSALALLANALATGAALYTLILVCGPVSGAHMNPVVTLGGAILEEVAWIDVPIYLSAQILGAIAGTLISHAMFGLPVLQVGSHVRTGVGAWTAEVVATFGLLAVIWGCLRYGRPTLAGAVGAYIAAAYWFTSSTSFANPAVTVARSFTDTFAGIRPQDMAGFIAAQVCGLALALPLLRSLKKSHAEDRN